VPAAAPTTMSHRKARRATSSVHGTERFSTYRENTPRRTIPTTASRRTAATTSSALSARSKPRWIASPHEARSPVAIAPAPSRLRSAGWTAGGRRPRDRGAPPALAEPGSGPRDAPVLRDRSLLASVGDHLLDGRHPADLGPELSPDWRHRILPGLPVGHDDLGALLDRLLQGDAVVLQHELRVPETRLARGVADHLLLLGGQPLPEPLGDGESGEGVDVA